MKVFQGIDISSVRRLSRAVQSQGQAFLDRLFTPSEQNYCEPKRRKFEHYAARFAAKEALMKAVETGGKRRCDFLDVEVRHRPTGKPYFFMSAKIRRTLGLKPSAQIELSLTHEREYAMAAVMILQP